MNKARLTGGDLGQRGRLDLNRGRMKELKNISRRGVRSGIGKTELGIGVRKM